MENDHFTICPTCGAMIDMRNLGQVLSHGWFNKDTQRYECETDDIVRALDAMAYTARRLGDPFEYRRDVGEIPLN